MNLVEHLIVAAALQYMEERPITSSVESTPLELDALFTIFLGFRSMGFRHVPGVIVDPVYPWFQAAASAVHYVKHGPTPKPRYST